jgi:HD-GYP domain-containing protein (c-di-GMP phosphodiesterase class II)
MTSPRPHREALSLDAALEQVRQLAGEQFDPRAAEALLSTPGDFLAGIQATGR